MWILKEYSTLKFYHTKEWKEEYVCVSDIQFWILGKLCLIFYQSIYLHNLEITHFSSRTLWISPFPIPELKPVLWIHQFFSFLETWFMKPFAALKMPIRSSPALLPLRELAFRVKWNLHRTVLTKRQSL